MFVMTLRKCGATILALGSGRTPVIALFLRDGVFWFLALVCTLFLNLQPARAHGQISKWCLLLRSSFGTERVRPWLKSPSCAFIFIDFQKPSLSSPMKSLDIVGTSLLACSLRLKKLFRLVAVIGARIVLNLKYVASNADIAVATATEPEPEQTSARRDRGERVPWYLKTSDYGHE